MTYPVREDQRGIVGDRVVVSLGTRHMCEVCDTHDNTVIWLGTYRRGRFAWLCDNCASDLRERLVAIHATMSSPRHPAALRPENV